MKQMDMGGLEIINIDYDLQSLPVAVQLFKPVIYMEGDVYHCLLGPDPQVGVFGSGDNPLQAMDHWDQHFRQTVLGGSMDNEVVQYILNKLTRS